MHILLIEDHEKLASNMKKYLESETYAVSMCHDGRQGFEKAMTQEIDLIILDINLPGMDGYVLCQMLRNNKKNMPILMLTARADQKEIIHGLNIGADDYLTKPFDMDELLARVRVLLRRRSADKQPILETSTLKIDTNVQRVEKNGKEINLAPKEYALLEFLVRRKDRVQDRPSIIEHVWGSRDDLLFSQTVDVHVAYLRRKLGKDTIRTIPGKGYMIPTN